MAPQIAVKNSLIIFMILFFTIVSFATDKKASTKDVDLISQIINSRTNGNDAFYSKALSPAQSLQTDKSKSERIQSMNKQITSEMNAVVMAFKNAAEDQKVTAVQAATNGIEPQLNANGGAFVTFFDSVPSAATSRILLIIPKKIKAGMSAATILNILTSYKHSPKQSDHLYEYASAQNLTQGSVKYVLGTDSTWKGSGAGAPFTLDKDYVLKKCRQLLGWRCVTSLYRAESQLKNDDAFKLLFISAYDLENNPDHADFAGDKRSNNQITGSTAAYVVKESSDWILVYGIDTQFNNGKLSFQGAIQSEFKKDFERLKERISFDLNVAL